jgi:hypothetical protein
VRPRRWVRRLAGVAGVVTLASVARADAPSDQYELFDVNDVTIQDHFTTLVWQRYPATSITSGMPATMTFDAAAAYCQGLSLGSYANGWRVPSYKELLTLVDEKPHLEFENGQLVPKAIDLHAFPGTPTAGTSYWTSSTYQDGRGYAVDFSDGTAQLASKANTSFYVRCVHD